MSLVSGVAVNQWHNQYGENGAVAPRTSNGHFPNSKKTRLCRKRVSVYSYALYPTKVLTEDVSSLQGGPAKVKPTYNFAGNI